MATSKIKPSQDWIDDCMHWYGKVLTGEKGHWRPGWDDLPIYETCPDFGACCCDLSFLDNTQPTVENLEV